MLLHSVLSDMAELQGDNQVDSSARSMFQQAAGQAASSMQRQSNSFLTQLKLESHMGLLLQH